MLKQKTLKDSFSLSGKGLHTGLDLTVTFNPAPDNHGYKIQRIDLEGQPTIDAVADNVTETTRGTVLSKNGVKVNNDCVVEVTTFNEAGGEKRLYFTNKDESTAGSHFVFEIVHILKCCKLIRDNG